MDECITGSADWCLLEMTRINLVEEAKKDIYEFSNKKKVDSTICEMCNVLLHYDCSTGDRICKKCGHAWIVYLDSNHNHHGRLNYNMNCIHHYTIAEHFSQSLVDLANIGNRTVPNSVMNFCRVSLGRGLHVTSMSVFKVLQQMGYRSYYQYKYEIANRLRGKREFTFSTREIQLLRDCFNRYRREIIPYQELKDIGSKSRNGKRRMFWPMRFILARLCEEIRREDVLIYIRPIACKKRYKIYETNWVDFTDYVQQRYPKALTWNEPLLQEVRPRSLQKKHPQQPVR